MRSTSPARLALAALACLTVANARAADDPWVVYPGGDGPGKGKHVVLVSGDEEYRSEEALPQLAKILAERHGFRCTVLFAVDKDGTINPNNAKNIPGLEALQHADLLILFTRFRDLPEDQMEEIVKYVDSGRPIIGMRTATHAFNMKGGHPFAGYSWNSTGWDGGFGRQVLGETWIAHYGRHGKEATRGRFAPGAEGSPILRGIKDGEIFGPTDVYKVRLPLPDCNPLVLGEVVDGMNPTDPPVAGEKNEVKMPVAWTKTYTSKAGKTGRVFTTTMGAATDLANEGVRRMLVNATYWAVGLEDKIPEKADVALVGEFKPTPFGFGGFVKGKRPADYAGK